MKVTLNLAKLLKNKEITKDDYDRFLDLAKKETDSHALSILMVFAFIAIVAGLIGFNLELFSKIIEFIKNAIGEEGISLLIIAFVFWLGSKTNSGFLIGITPFMILNLLEDSTFYSHDSLVFSIVIFSILALVGLSVSKNVDLDKERLALIFSKVCLVIVNWEFLFASLRGSNVGVTDIKISDTVLSVVWALAIFLCGAWGAKEGRRFVVNTCAVFGSIHFYIQWFLRLGASPGSLLGSGVVALFLIYALRSYNQKMN